MSDADAAVGPLREAVAVALDEDLGVLGDLTSQAIIPEDALGTGHFVAREEGVLAGTQAVDEVYRQLDPDITVTWRVQDGDRVAAGHELGRVFGRMRSILSGERTALNFLCHLAGVATLTRAFVQAAGGGVRVLDGSPAVDAGIRAGDEIETVDGKPAGEIGLSALRERLRVDGQALKLELKRGDDRVTVAMKTRRMI